MEVPVMEAGRRPLADNEYVRLANLEIVIKSPDPELVGANKSPCPTTLTENPPWSSGDSISWNICLYFFIRPSDFDGDWAAYARFFVWVAEDVRRKKVLATDTQVEIAILKSRFRKLDYTRFHRF